MPPASELTHTRSSAGVSERRSEGRLLCVLFTCRREKVESLEREGPQDALHLFIATVGFWTLCC